MNTSNYGPVVIPEYGSLIVNKTSNGLGGEIYIHESDKSFFNTTGEIISVQGKKGKGCKNVYVLNERNEYTFDFNNLIDYLVDVKNEFAEHNLHKYVDSKRKKIDSRWWEARQREILEKKDDLSFEPYLKKSTKKRCFLGVNDKKSIYMCVFAYTIIPYFTELIIEKKIRNNGGALFVFRIFFNINKSVEVLNKKQKNIEASYIKEYTTEELIRLALTKEELKESEQTKHKDGQQVKKKRINYEYDRDPLISAAVKKRADGKCDLCGEDAPFKDEKGQPFLEEHHVDWLMNNGKDSIYNAVALCPNCHRRIHILNDLTDVEKLKNRLRVYKERLS